MPAELDPKHVHHFPFAPVGVGKDSRRGGYLWIAAVHRDSQLDRKILSKGGQLVDNMEAGGFLRPVVDRGQGREQGELMLVPQEGEDIGDLVTRDEYVHLTPRL